MIKYSIAHDINNKVKEIISALNMEHINSERIFCLRSRGTKSKAIIARCHALPRALQLALETKPAYVIEVISENFDKMPEDEQIKTLIHELLHVPKAFGGGFRHHDHVTRKRIEQYYKRYLALKE